MLVNRDQLRIFIFLLIPLPPQSLSFPALLGAQRKWIGSYTFFMSGYTAVLCPNFA